MSHTPLSLLLVFSNAHNYSPSPSEHKSFLLRHNLTCDALRLKGLLLPGNSFSVDGHDCLHRADHYHIVFFNEVSRCILRCRLPVVFDVNTLQ